MRRELINWIIFIVLSFVWGSSFILIKLGISSLTPYQVASLRIISAGIVLLPIALKSIRSIPLNKLGLVFLSGVLGALLPAFLFCLAETRIDSALAGTLNSLTPVFAIITGALFFKYPIQSNKISGILIAFAGSILLLFTKGFKVNNNLFYMSYVVLATFFYGINVNLVHKYLSNIGSLKIASVALTLCSIPALIVLYFTGYFQLSFGEAGILKSTVASTILGIAGTAIATIFFYMLIKRAGPIFSSMITYGIPFVAIFWGLFINENITWKQIAALIIILAGIYIANRNYKRVIQPD